MGGGQIGSTRGRARVAALVLALALIGVRVDGPPAAAAAPPVGSFSLTYVGVPAAAQPAIAQAASVLSAVIDSPVPVTARFEWRNDMGMLAGAKVGGFVYRNFPEAPRADTLYPEALTNALRGFDQNPTTPDIVIRLNASANWYLGTSGAPSANQTDLQTVALHELIHGLGFSDSFTRDAGGACSWGETPDFSPPYSPGAFDRFLVTGGGQRPVGDFANLSAAMCAPLTGDNLFFDGPTARAGNGGRRVKVYAPGEWSPTASIGHLDDRFGPPPNPDATMLAATPPGTASRTVGPATAGILADIGWPMKPGVVSPPASAPDLALTVSHTGSFTVAQPGTYRLQVTNVGPGATVSPIVITDTLPASMEFASASGAGWTCATAVLQPVQCVHPGPVPPGGTLPLDLVVVPNALAVPSATNQASVATRADANAANNDASDPTTVVMPPGVPDLAVTLTHAGDFTEGTPGDFVAHVTNVGTAPTSGPITLVDVVPYGMFVHAASGSGWSCGNDSPWGIPFGWPSRLTCTHPGPVAPGGSLPDLTVKAVYDVGADDTYNEVTVATPGDVNPFNDDEFDDVTVLPGGPRNLAVSLTHQGTLRVGTTATLRLAITNQGPGPSPGTFFFNYSLPPGLELQLDGITNAPAWWVPFCGWDAPSRTMSCAGLSQAGPITGGTTLTVDIPVTVTAAAYPSATATAALSGNSDTNSLDDTALLAATVLPEAPVVSIGDAAVVEGDAGTRVVRFPVTLSRPADAPVTVSYAVRGGTAIGSGDFDDAKGKTKVIKFKPSAKTGLTPTVKYVSVKVFPDTVDEGDESLLVSLTDASGLVLGRAEATGTILDDDPGTDVRISIGDATVTEGNDGTRTVALAVTLSAPAATRVTVRYAIVGGTATPGVDLDAVKGGSKALTFTPSAKTGLTPVTKYVTLTIRPDAVGEGDETVLVGLSGSNGPPVTRATGTVTIVDDDT
jgi:uncharacterized repeat protein (TIGR01451 family)